MTGKKIAHWFEYALLWRNVDSTVEPSPQTLSVNSKSFLHAKTIMEVNRAMLKTAKAIFLMTACFGLIFTSLSPALFAEVAKPVAAVVEGQNIWVTDSGDHRLVKLRASDGTLLGSYPIPSPLRLIYD